ncbi:hypothetical protein PT974_10311 [Cladobotryum mycophilum]|uniref:Uncharacterized protein n=1 Tax=Cladobotryum mycophilum TaxID=491253 RepID=A0ABR0SAE8_9HYPO
MPPPALKGKCTGEPPHMRQDFDPQLAVVSPDITSKCSGFLLLSRIDNGLMLIGQRSMNRSQGIAEDEELNMNDSISNMDALFYLFRGVYRVEPVYADAHVMSP